MHIFKMLFSQILCNPLLFATLNLPILLIENTHTHTDENPCDIYINIIHEYLEYNINIIQNVRSIICRSVSILTIFFNDILY